MQFPPHRFCCSNQQSISILFMEEQKKSPSFCHLPADIKDTIKLRKAENKDINKLKKAPSTDMLRRTSLRSSTIFEFTTNQAVEMSPAEDIISRGRIIPLRGRSLSSFPHREKQPLSMSPLSPLHQAAKGDTNNKMPNILPRRSESLPDFQSAAAPSESPKWSALMGNKSIDHRKFGRSKSMMMMMSNCGKSPARTPKRSDTSSRNKANKPRWYNFMFGVGTLPQEMKLDDMKTRWLRKSPSTMFAQVDENGDLTGKQNSEKRSWTLLRRAFSCKRPGCAVDTSPNCVTHAA